MYILTKEIAKNIKTPGTSLRKETEEAKTLYTDTAMVESIKVYVHCCGRLMPPQSLGSASRTGFMII